MSYRFADSLRAGSEWNVLILLASCNCNLYDTYHCCVYSEKLLMMDMHLVGFIIRIYRDARSPERQTEYDMRGKIFDAYFFLYINSTLHS